MTPTLGLALIARDEEDTLPRLLASVEGAFDQVALLDTGSTDRTVEVFEEWSAAEKRRRPGFVSTLGHFDWCDDFAAARNSADDLLETDWLCWADADDTISNATLLRRLAADVPLIGMRFPYVGPGFGPSGEDPGRMRMVRAGSARWFGRVHEVLWVDGPHAIVDCDPPVRWHHRKPGDTTDYRPAARRWAADEPDNPLPFLYWATEAVARGDLREAAEVFGRYLVLPAVQDELSRDEAVASRRAIDLLVTGAAPKTMALLDAIMVRPTGFWIQKEADLRLAGRGGGVKRGPRGSR